MGWVEEMVSLKEETCLLNEPSSLANFFDMIYGYLYIAGQLYINVYNEVYLPPPSGGKGSVTYSGEAFPFYI